MPAHAVDLDLRRPFLRADAIAAGVSPSSLRGRRFRRIFTGVYVHASVPAHPLLRVQGALVLHPPTAFASHVSAARVYDVPLPTLADGHVSVLSEKDRRRRLGIRNHVAAPAPRPSRSGVCGCRRRRRCSSSSVTCSASSTWSWWATRWCGTGG